jgi:outer membrane autotransporter protein
MGDIRSDANESGVWMRWDGGKLKGDAGLTNDFNTVQVGVDSKAGTENTRFGLAASFTYGDSSFARGNADMEGLSFAGYGVWMAENGMFADVIARLGSFDTDMKVEGREGSIKNLVASVSGEFGWRFNVCDQFFIEPQMELGYTFIKGDDFSLGSSQYTIDHTDSLLGRAGLVAGWNLPNGLGNVYARASVLQQFMGDSKISGTAGGAANVQSADGKDTWLEYGIGANVKLSKNTYIWADVERTEGAKVDEEWRGTVGLRWSF